MREKGETFPAPPSGNGSKDSKMVFLPVVFLFSELRGDTSSHVI
jgi:hypothetical protein